MNFEVKRHKKKTIYKIIHIILLGLIFLEYRAKGFKFIQRGFKSIESTSGLYEVVQLKKHQGIYRRGSKNFQMRWAAACGLPIDGYATTKNEIYIH